MDGHGGPQPRRLDPPVPRQMVTNLEQAAARPEHCFRRISVLDEHKLRIGEHHLLAALSRSVRSILVERVTAVLAPTSASGIRPPDLAEGPGIGRRGRIRRSICRSRPRNHSGGPMVKYGGQDALNSLTLVRQIAEKRGGHRESRAQSIEVNNDGFETTQAPEFQVIRWVNRDSLPVRVHRSCRAEWNGKIEHLGCHPLRSGPHQL